MGDFNDWLNFVSPKRGVKVQVSLNIKESLVVKEAAVGDTDYKVQCIVLILSYCKVLC